MSDEAALLKAIVSHADEDTPRLAYADWLDEHNDPDRAAFIRVQCRLAEMSPADPEWVDLTEQQHELVARLQHRDLTALPGEPDDFHFGDDALDSHEEPFRRGFPYFIQCQVSEWNWTPDEVRRVVADLTRLVRTTTIRGFHPYSIPVEELKLLLDAPVVGELTGLSLMPFPMGDWPTASADYYRAIATSPNVRRVRELFLYGGYGGTPAPAIAELARATSFDSVRRLTLQDLNAPKATIDKLTRAPWFRRLRHFRSGFDKAVAAPMVTGLGKLPDLHTLDITHLAPAGVAALAAGKFPALALLDYGGPLGVKHVNSLAGARFPSLAAFVACGGLTNNALFALMKAKWFGRLRVLDLSFNSLGDKGVKALATHPFAKALRSLQLGENEFGASGLAPFTRPGAFPALTSLHVGHYTQLKGKPAELAAILSAFQLPSLRHLNLSGWPLGDAGAKALAANPTFAGLTRLTVEFCGIGDAGAEAIFASPHLQNLVELRMGSNSVKAGADAIANRSVMPRLGECWLNDNRLPATFARGVKRKGLYLMT